MKSYIPGETKEQRRARKQQEKQTTTPAVSLSPVTNTSKRYVACLKYGNKYSSDYVNKLYNMVKRNLTIEHEFVCFTENPEGIDENVRIIPLSVSSAIQGWWYKPMFFNPKLEIKGTILFLDLDLVIFRNIDKLFAHRPGEFVIIRDFNRYIIRDYSKFNSSVFRLETGQHAHVFTNFIRDPKAVIRAYHGDQDWIRHCIKSDYCYWPDDWIQSYKWEMRGKPQFDKKPRGERDFVTPGHPRVLDETSIAVFHGDPNPHNCKDPWVIDNWQ
jgi:hypothetical protein